MAQLSAVFVSRQDAGSSMEQQYVDVVMIDVIVVDGNAGGVGVGGRGPGGCWRGWWC